MDRPLLRSRRLAATAAAVAVVAAVAGAGPASADNVRSGRPLSVTVTVGAPTPVGGDFGCDPTDPARCVGTFRNVRTFSGDFNGTAYQVGAAAILPDGTTYQGAGVVLFTGSVKRCGTGTMLIVETGRLDAGTGAGSGTWEITAGQGTGDLANVSGSLALDSHVGDAATGKLRCR